MFYPETDYAVKICKFLIGIFLTLSTNHLLFSQAITVVDTLYSTQELTNIITGNSCVPTTNYAISSSKSVAYFNNNNGSFPITEGIIIRSGLANYTQGTYTNENLGSQVNTNGDADLQTISDNEGQVSLITDVAFLQFDFVPLANNINFNFIFASNEYGEWQCGFSDIFAIILTNKATGETTNIATLSNTNTTISVRNIRNKVYNSSCNSVNETFFSNLYNTSNNAPLNMRGHTVKLNASATIIPNTEYTIKFVIGDYNDSDFDSAVFIEANSFTSEVDLGENITACTGENVTIDTGFKKIPNLNFEWEFNNEILINQTDASITVNQPGNYRVKITDTNLNCTLTDEVEVREISYNTPADLFICQATSEIDITQNSYAELGILDTEYQIEYYASLQDIDRNNPINNTSRFLANNGDTIYIKLRSTTTHQLCDTVLSFQINTIHLEVITPEDITICEDRNTINIPQQVANQLLQGIANPTLYEIEYYTSENTIITNPTHFPIPNNTDFLQITAKVSSIVSSDCFDDATFQINIENSPLVDQLPNVFECDSYTLPPLTNGAYYTESGGNGEPLPAGTVITSNTTIFIYNETNNGCTNQHSFTVNITKLFQIESNYCEFFAVPSYPNANFYTAAGGPTGAGELIPSGTVLTNSQTLYFYATTPTGEFCVEKNFNITILTPLAVDSLEDVVVCDAYTLPPLTNGRYYTVANGRGNQLTAGELITSNTTLYIYNTDSLGVCASQTSFKINIFNTDAFQAINTCGKYVLPAVDFGNYYTEAHGNGVLIPEGTVITTSQTIHLYVPEFRTLPNCNENTTFSITINPLPLVDALEDIVRCENNLPKLPNLTNGRYFTEPNGNGVELFQGNTISISQKIYIYNTNQFCSGERSFNVNIRELPQVDNFTDIFSCSQYILPQLTNGNYYTEPNGLGVQLNAGNIITETKTIYIYNTHDDLTNCTNENVFTVNILGITVDKPENVMTCLSYQLPELSVGNYYTEARGRGIQLNAGDIITETQTIYIYAKNNNRFFCSDEHAFRVTVLKKPSLDAINNMEGCGRVTLPNLSNTEVTYEFYEGPNQTNLLDTNNYTLTNVGSKTLYLRAYHNLLPNCYTEKVIVATVYPLLDLVVEGGTICVDKITGQTINPVVLESGLDESAYEVNWYFNNRLVATNPNYEATIAGVYTIETIKLSPEIGANCNYKSTEVVVTSSSPAFEIVHLSEDFDKNHSVKVNTIDEGLGKYIFAINQSDYQNSPYFYNLPPGEYTISIKDTKALCNTFTLSFVVLDYPKFFTPNFDGINDTWNIKDLKNRNQATIKIFDRYGKFIAQISPDGVGWDGRNSSGNKMPTTDYWFVANYLINGEHKIFKSNFSLLRR